MIDNGNKKVHGVRVHFEECEHGGMHVTDVSPITDIDVVYDAPDSDDVLASSTLGWSSHPCWDKNWEATFGDKTEPELN